MNNIPKYICNIYKKGSFIKRTYANPRFGAKKIQLFKVVKPIPKTLTDSKYGCYFRFDAIYLISDHYTSNRCTMYFGKGKDPFYIDEIINEPEAVALAL